MKFKRKKLLFWLFVSFLVVLIVVLNWGMNHPRQINLQASSSSSPNIKSPQLEAINILLLGIPGSGFNGALLTDSIMLLHLDFTQKKVTAISFPRDLWVQIPHSNQQSKLNALYALSNNQKKSFPQTTSYQLIQEKIEEISNLKIDYIVIFDLTGFSKLVDALGGINIWLDQEMFDPNLVNPHNPSEMFELHPGWNYLDGATAVKFVRTRYASSGDFYRMNNQHLILKALWEKVNQLSHVWNLMSWLKIYESLANHYITNLNFNTLWEIFNLFKDLKEEQIKFLSITNRPPDNLLISASRTETQDNATSTVYLLLPKAGFENYQEIQTYLQNNL